MINGFNYIYFNLNIFVNPNIVMPKDDKQNLFSCDKLKGSVNAGTNEIITFTFKPPSIIETIANIDALKGLGQWKELKAELKLIGGYLP